MKKIDREEVLRLVKMRGPLIPNDLRKALGKGDTTILGAILSELSSKGLVKISKTKLGGSPFYYDPNRPDALERISDKLGEKDQRTYNLLKAQKILRDDTQEALTRVSLRNIKDFARMLTINAPEGRVIYWKYYLVSDADAEVLIKQDLGMGKPKEPAPIPTEPVKPAPQIPTIPVPKENIPKAEPPKPTPSQPTPPTPTQPPEPTPPKKETPKTKETEPTKKPTPTPQKEKPAPKEELQESLPTELEKIDDPFYEKIKAYFDQHKIKVKEQTLVRKKSELDFVILLPTPVGDVEYYCKAKAKKKSNDGDLASAKLQGNSINLPVLYITTGEITKKAKEKLSNDFKGMVAKEL